MKKPAKSTVELKITIPADVVAQTRQQVLEDFAKTTEIKGFRKGNAPLELVEKAIDAGKINGEVVNRLLQKYYVQALKEKEIHPVANPKVEILKFGTDEDFEFKATIAVRPEVKLGDYKKALKKKLKAKKEEAKKAKEEALKEGKPLEHVHDHLHAEEIIETIAESAKMELPEMLIESEVDRYMARLVDQMRAINMDITQYLEAQHKSVEDFRAEYAETARKNLEAEFALMEAIKQEGIKVTDAEIEEAAKASGSEDASKLLLDETNRWYIRSILEKNKLLMKLVDELEEKKEEKDKNTKGDKDKKSDEVTEKTGSDEKNNKKESDTKAKKASK